MTKRGAEGLRIVDGHRLHLDKLDRGRYRVYAREGPSLGPMLGVATRERHTVRTAYTGTRIGYDRTHWCWHVQPAGLIAGTYLPRQASWCHTTLQSALAVLL